ncbi:MAG TPA: hypothetical protein VKZ92_08020 [Pseudohongiella sp.]|nr:hypothetical protein [Pseudohongiella sp.]
MRYLIGFLVLVLCLPVRATTIAQLEFSELIDTAELVFEGRVLDVYAEQTGPRSIHTTVRFEIIEVIKGVYAESELELRYLGGRVGERELRVDGMQFPQPGEHGIYFVESVQEALVHPMVGWSQGHYLILSTPSNSEAVYTADGRGVNDVQEPESQTAPAILGHDGTARGLVVQQQQAPLLSPDQFKTIVRDYLATGALP